jgi:septum formation topological specificity factor MinE
MLVILFLKHPPTDPELKERIEAFITERRNRKKAEPSALEEEAVEMDVN